jgi:dipeptidyl aminopeptidase/acylaminoacyl peptidase
MRRLASALLLAAAAPAPAQEKRAITPADYASVATATEVAVSPDGKLVAYTLATWDEKADNRRTDLWVVSTDGKGQPKQLTSDRANDRHPKWGIGGALFVLRNVKTGGAKEPPLDGSSQVWRIEPDGTATPVTRVKGGVEGYDYSPKTALIFYTTDAVVTDPGDFAELRTQYPKIDYGHGKRKVSELYLTPAEGGRGVKIYEGKRYIREFVVSPDSRRVAMITAPDDSVIRSEGDSRVDVLETETKGVSTTDQDWRKTAGSPWPWLESLAWNPAGTRLAYCTIFDGYPAEVITCESFGGRWTATRAKREGWQVRGYGSPLRWRDNAVLGVLADSYGQVILAHHDVQSGFTGMHPIVGAYYAVDYVRGDTGRWAAIHGRPDGLAEVVMIDASRNRTQLSRLNPQVKEWALPSVSRITWKAPDGATVGGALELPAGYKTGEKKLPLVVAIHGGPTTSSTAALQFDPHNARLYFAAAGYAVLAPNYRGSTGYGDKHTTDLIGRENDLDVKDILAGVKHLIDAGIADPDRIGVAGWSNGGYLTNCLISMPDPPVKFRAASSGAGILDTVMEWGTNDEPAYTRALKTGLPWERPDVFRRTSPTYQLGNVKTPTLIHVGANDERCPPGHSRMLYRALKENLNVPTQLLVYPGEPHGLSRLSHRRAKMEWDLAWFDRYLRPDRP